MREQPGKGRVKKPVPDKTARTILPVVSLMDCRTRAFMRAHGGRMPSQKELCEWLDEMYGVISNI